MIGVKLNKFFSLWKNVPKGPADPIFATNERYLNDKNIRKANLALGVYKDGKVPIFRSVTKAKNLLSALNDHDYPLPEGLSSFTKAALSLTFSDTPGFKDNRIASFQTLSGTGGLFLALLYIKNFYPYSNTVYIPRPTWVNHANVINESGLFYKYYSYYDANTKSLDFENMTKDIENASKNSVFLLQACGHNPTGTDLRKDQWAVIQDLMAYKQHLALFVLNYPGLVSGNIHDDSFSINLFAEQENPLIVVQSFSAIFGLYGERTGNLCILCDSEFESQRVISQLSKIAESLYFSPPLYSAQLISTILNSPELKSEWVLEIKEMSERIIKTRSKLCEVLKQKRSLHDWSHIIRQKGIFAYTGLSPDKCDQLIKRFHIYLTLDGRISLTGINNKNIDYIADAIENITRFSNN